MTPDIRTRTQDCICLAVRQAARHVTQSYDHFLAPAGLRTTQFSILAKLKRKGPMTINALAAELVMDRTTLGRNILPLERDGLISVEPLASDRRSKALHLTKAGDKRGWFSRGGLESQVMQPGDALIVPTELDFETFGRALVRNLKDFERRERVVTARRK